MITETVAFDYITYTTYNTSTYNQLTENIDNLDMASRPMKIQQYDGRQWAFHNGSTFLGMGQQPKGHHYMITTSSDKADEVVRNNVGVYSSGDVVTTRVDTQITLPCPFPKHSLYDLFVDYAKVCSDHEEEKGTRGRKIELIASPSGECTLYIGSKHSSKRYCIYVKWGMSGDMFVRFEVRYKKSGGLADKILRGYGRKGQDYINGIMGSEIDSMPHHKITRLFSSSLDASGRVLQEKRVLDDNKTIKWLSSSVRPAIRRLYNSDNERIRDIVINFVDSLSIDFGS